MTLLEECRAVIAEHYKSGADLKPVAQSYVLAGKVSHDDWNALIAEVNAQHGNPAGNTAVLNEPRPAPIGHGPGTELTKMFAAAKIPSCQRCKDLAARMDAWGIEGCRQHKAEIVVELSGRAIQFSWAKKFEIGARLATMGIVLNPLAPFPGLVDEAIRRAQLDQAESPSG